MFKSRWMLKPGPTAETPVTLVIESREPDEDGGRARLEVDLALDELEAAENDFAMARSLVRKGVWKPSPR